MTDHIPLGWICPRCGHVWAPDVRECTSAPVAEVLVVGSEWVETTMLDVSGAEVR